MLRIVIMLLVLTKPHSRYIFLMVVILSRASLGLARTIPPEARTQEKAVSLCLGHVLSISLAVLGLLPQLFLKVLRIFLFTWGIWIDPAAVLPLA